MPPKPSNSIAPAPKPEDALKTLLSLGQLLELDTLVTNVSNSMHAQIEDVFDNSYKTSNDMKPLLADLERNPNVPNEIGAEAERKPPMVETTDLNLNALKEDTIENFQTLA